MTVDDLREHVWKRLGLRKFLLGRSGVDDLVTLAVENWQGEYMNAAQTDADRDIVMHGTLVAMKRMHQLHSGKDTQEYGFVWAILLQALAYAVLQIIVKWWLERRTHRVLLAVWQAEMTR